MVEPAEDPVVELAGVSVRRGGTTILGPLDWRIERGERWVVLGPNGSGKTTLLQVVSTYVWPSTGTVSVLGQRIGAIDARELRRRIGYAGSGLERAVDEATSAADLVVSARHAALATWWHRYSDVDRERADALLGRLGVRELADRPFGLLSTGERRRVLIARALMPDPELLLLDEPTASLDLGAREALVEDLETLAADRRLAAIVLVTHHVEEIPAGFGAGLLLRAGAVVAHGSIATVVAAEPLSATFGSPLEVGGQDGRFHARRAR